MQFLHLKQCALPLLLLSVLVTSPEYLVPLQSVALALSLSFASGAMLYVVFGELLPESILMWRSKVPAAAAIIGMMTGLLIIYL